MRQVTGVLQSPKFKRGAELAIGPVLLIVLWWIAFKGGLVNKDLLPSPFETLRDTGANIAAGKMTNDFVRTLARVAYSILIAVVAGVPIEIVLGAKAAIYRSVNSSRLLPLDAGDRAFPALPAAVRPRRFRQDRSRGLRGMARHRL